MNRLRPLHWMLLGVLVTLGGLALAQAISRQIAVFLDGNLTESRAVVVDGNVYLPLDIAAQLDLEVALKREGVYLTRTAPASNTGQSTAASVGTSSRSGGPQAVGRANNAGHSTGSSTAGVATSGGGASQGYTAGRSNSAGSSTGSSSAGVASKAGNLPQGDGTDRSNSAGSNSGGPSTGPARANSGPQAEANDRATEEGDGGVSGKNKGTSNESAGVAAGRSSTGKDSDGCAVIIDARGFTAEMRKNPNPFVRDATGKVIYPDAVRAQGVEGKLVDLGITRFFQDSSEANLEKYSSVVRIKALDVLGTTPQARFKDGVKVSVADGQKILNSGASCEMLFIH